MLLIVDKSAKRGKTISEMAHIMGFISYSITPYEFFNEISPFYSAILMIEPMNFKEDREFFEKIVRYKLGIPLFALCSRKSDIIYHEYFDKIFEDQEFSSKITDEMINYASANALRPIGKYCGFGFQASANFSKPEYFEEPLDITKTEIMILRLLLRVYPTPMSAADIFKYAFRPGRRIELSSIKTHISLLNKGCRSCVEKNAVEFIQKSGYAISVPKVKPEYALYDNLI